MVSEVLKLWMGRTQCGMRLRELGELVSDLDYATVSVATKRWSRRTAEDAAMKKHAARAVPLLKDLTPIANETRIVSRFFL